MSTVIGQPTLPSARPQPLPTHATRRLSRGDRLFFGLLQAATLIPLLLMAAFLAMLIYSAWPSIAAFGAHFLVTSTWDPNPAHETYGALPFLYGTLVSSIGALALAAPIGIGVAVFLNEVFPARLRGVVAFLIEILATIPSVVYGLWGIFVLAPWVRQYAEPFLARTLGVIPLVGDLFSGPRQGFGMLAAILVLAIMVLPIIVSVSLDSVRMVPSSYREAALALGATRWEMMRLAVLPAARSGLLGGCILALARALGETMAVTMVIGNRHGVSLSLFAPGDTVASVIASQFPEANSSLFIASLIELALLLFFITLVVNLLARAIVGRLSGKMEALA